MDQENQNLLWLRVAALRGIEHPERGGHAHVSGDRFQVEITSTAAPNAEAAERVFRRVRDPACRGVIGEIVATPMPIPSARRSRVPTTLGLGTPPPTWRHALVTREAERLAGLQPERRSR